MGLRVILNFALSVDGKISTRSKSPAHFTSRKDLDRLHHLRQQADAILVGRGTLEADNMSLTTRGTKHPWRCVISRTGAFHTDHPLFHTKGGPIHLIITEGNAAPIENTTLHHCSLSEWLAWLSEQPTVETLLCEGGGSLAHQLFQLDAVDEINLTLAAHTLFGGKEAPTLTGIPADFLPQSRKFELTEVSEAREGEFFLTYQRKQDLPIETALC